MYEYYVLVPTEIAGSGAAAAAAAAAPSAR